MTSSASGTATAEGTRITSFPGTQVPTLTPTPLLLASVTATPTISASPSPVVPRVILGSAPDPLAIRLNGHAQTLDVALPSVTIDPLPTGDQRWQVRLHVTLAQPDGASVNVSLGPLRVRSDVGGTTELSLVGSPTSADAVLVLPASSSATSDTLWPVVRLGIPASARAGSYVPRLDATLEISP